MPEIITVTQADIDGLGRKLDEFSAVLTERERTVLYGVLGMAGKSIEEVVQSHQGGTPSGASEGQLPSLSQQFQDAFENGVGTRFQVHTPSEAESTRVKGSVDGDWTKA